MWNLISLLLDFSELIHSLTEHPGRMVKCRGLRNVYASRACRKSKMFGDPLNYKEMVQIVQHMGELDHPWVSSGILVYNETTLTHAFE